MEPDLLHYLPLLSGVAAAKINMDPDLFHSPVQSAAELLAEQPPPDVDAERREDLTHLTIYTIDDASTTEIDDGVGSEILPDGRTQVGRPEILTCYLPLLVLSALL